MKILKYIIFSLFSIIVLSVFIIIALVMDNEVYQVYQLQNIQKSSEFILQPEEGQGALTYDIHLTGNIVGKAKLKFYENHAVNIPERDINRSLSEIVDEVIEHWMEYKNDQPYIEIELSGQIDIKKVASEYYGNGFYIKYIPKNVKEGNLKIEYHF